MVKTSLTTLVCALALLGHSHAQEVFIGTQKTKPKSTPVQPGASDHAKTEKTTASQPLKSAAPAGEEVPVAKTAVATKQNSSGTLEKKSSMTADSGAKLAGSSPVKAAAQSASQKTAAHSETKQSVAVKEATTKSPTVTIHQQASTAEKKSSIVPNDSLSKRANSTAKSVATVAAPAHPGSKSVNTDATASLPLAAVPPPSKSKLASSTVAKPAVGAVKKVATVEVATSNSESISPGPKPQVASGNLAKAAGTSATKSAAAVIKHPGLISAPEKAAETPTITVAKSSQQKSSTAPSKTDGALKAGGEKSRAMIAGMIAAQAEKQSLASVTPVVETAAAETTISQSVNNHFDTAFTKLADGFDFPVGKPDAEGYYKARGFRSHGHLGEDWDGVRGGDTDLGDPIYSVGDGLVVFARDCHMGWGNVLIVRHSYREGGTIKTVDALYGHLNSMLVHRGQAVTRGQKIATMGNAHGLYDAHLHLEIRKNLEIGMSRAAFAQDFSNYYDPTQFIQMHRHLQTGGGTYRVAMNTFTRDARIRWDKTRNYSRAHTGGGTSESAAALKKAVAAKH